MLIDGYVAEQIKNAMLNSEQEQVKIYDAYYNKGVTDGYNKALEDMRKGIKEILEDNAIYNIDCIDTLVNQLTK
jgi:hypothetical protein